MTTRAPPPPPSIPPARQSPHPSLPPPTQNSICPLPTTPPTPLHATQPILSVLSSLSSFLLSLSSFLSSYSSFFYHLYHPLYRLYHPLYHLYNRCHLYHLFCHLYHLYHPYHPYQLFITTGFRIDKCLKSQTIVYTYMLCAVRELVISKVSSSVQGLEISQICWQNLAEVSCDQGKCLQIPCENKG